MAKSFTAPAGTSDRTRAEVEGRVPALRRDGTCELYAPGHQIHYRHQGEAVRSPSVAVVNAVLDGPGVTLLLGSGRELHWRHHDPDRLRRMLELLRGRCVAYPEHHALRVGPYWFNCAAESDDWQECRVTQQSSAT